MKTKLDLSKPNETVHNRSRIETVTSDLRKGGGLKQNRRRFCCSARLFSIFKVTVSQIGPENFRRN
jgi:hypothetical protein